MIRFHDLRHTWATILRHTGVPMEDIQKFLGHSTIMTTEGIYAHFDDAQHRSTITKFGDYLSDKTKGDEMGNVVSNQKEMQKQQSKAVFLNKEFQFFKNGMGMYLLPIFFTNRKL